MKYLFIDTTTHDLIIAISSIDEIFSVVTSSNINEHSKYALLEMQKAFEDAELKPNEIDKIVVVNGPGSFTGVRIGVTIAKTYAWALKKEVIPISSLLVHALAYSSYDYYVSVLDARRGFVYGAIYDNQYKPILEEQYISSEKLEEAISKLTGSLIVIGDINIGNYKNAPIKTNVLNAINYSKDILPVNAHSLKPRYLKLVEAEEKLKEAEQ